MNPPLKQKQGIGRGNGYHLAGTYFVTSVPFPLLDPTALVVRPPGYAGLPPAVLAGQRRRWPNASNQSPLDKIRQWRIIRL